MFHFLHNLFSPRPKNQVRERNKQPGTGCRLHGRPHSGRCNARRKHLDKGRCQAQAPALYTALSSGLTELKSSLQPAIALQPATTALAEGFCPLCDKQCPASAPACRKGVAYAQGRTV